VGELRAYLLVDDASGLIGEMARLEKEAAKARQYADAQRAKLSNEKFVGKAPEHVIAAERAKLEEAEGEASALEVRRKRLSELV